MNIFIRSIKAGSDRSGSLENGMQAGLQVDALPCGKREKERFISVKGLSFQLRLVF